jgi:hypothetical protein
LFEAGDVHGLGKVGVEAGGDTAADVFFHAEAGESDGGDAGEIANGADEVDAGAIGKADVAGEEIDVRGAEVFKGFGDSGDGFDVMAKGVDEADHDAGGVGVVFNKEDAEGTGGAGSGLVSSGGLGGGRRDGGKLEGEGGALAGARAGGADMTIVEFDEGLGDGEAEAEAAVASGDKVASLFEGVEEAVELVGLDADAGVLDVEEERRLRRSGGWGLASGALVVRMWMQPCSGVNLAAFLMRFQSICWRRA